MMNREKKFLIKTIFILFFLNIIVFSASIFFFSMIKEKNQKAFAFEEEISTVSKQEEEISLINESLEETAEERKKINSYFVQSGKVGVASFIEKIEDISNISNVSIEVNGLFLTGQDVDEEDSEAVTEKMRLTLRTVGDWENLVYFLELLEAISYDVSFEKVYFEKSTIENSTQWEALFNLNVLKIKD